MAITKIHPIRRTLSKAIEYVIDPVKAPDDMLITTFGCTKESAAEEFLLTKRSGNERCFTLAQHVIQSFKPGEIDSKTAHEIAVKLANQYTGSQHEYIIATHVDKGHIHSHIIFNHTNFITHKAFRGNIKASKDLQRISDNICREYGLSVIENPKNKGMTKYEWMMRKKGLSYKRLLQDNIDICINSSNSFEEFLTNMQKLGYEIKQGKYIAFRKNEQERYTRSKSLGPEYTEDAIKDRIASHPTTNIKTPFTYNPSLGLIRNMENYIVFIENPVYRQKVALSNAKKLSGTYNFLKNNQIDSMEDLNKALTNTKSEIKDLRESIRTLEQKIHTTSELMLHINRVNEYKDTNKKYISTKNPDSFFESHYSEILLYETSIKYLKETLSKESLPSPASIKKSLKILEIEKYDFIKKLNLLKEKQTELDAASKNISLLFLAKVHTPLPSHIR